MGSSLKGEDKCTPYVQFNCEHLSHFLDNESYSIHYPELLSWSSPKLCSSEVFFHDLFSESSIDELLHVLPFYYPNLVSVSDSNTRKADIVDA